MAWFYVVLAGIFEVVWATGLKYSYGFTRLYPSIVTIIGAIISFYFLSIATKSVSIGTAYAIFTGIGALGTVIIGIIFLKEPFNMIRILFLVFILIGIIGLKLTSSNQ